MIKQKLVSLKEKLEDAWDFIFNDTVLNIGEVAVNLFTILASGYWFVTGKLPIIPQFAWGGIMLFALITGTYSLGNLVNPPDDEELEDDEVVGDF